MKSPLKIMFAVAIALAVTACDAKPVDPKINAFLTALGNALATQDTVPLSDVATFEWDTVCVPPDYAFAADDPLEVKAKYIDADLANYKGAFPERKNVESRPAIFFITGRHIAEVYDIPDSRFSVSGVRYRLQNPLPYDKSCVTRELAIARKYPAKKEGYAHAISILVDRSTIKKGD